MHPRVQKQILFEGDFRRLRRLRARTQPQRPRLWVEPLEIRCVPSTFQDFDVPGSGSPYLPGQFANPPGPTIMDGGPTGFGKFLRLASDTPVPMPPSVNTISFDRTDPGTFNEIVASFAIRMTPGAGRADGIGFTMLNTATFGITGMVGGNAEEPNFPGSLGVGFDIFQNTGDLNNNEVSIHFDKNVVIQVDATPAADLAGGQWIGVQIIMRPGGGFSDVSLILTPAGGQPVTLIDRLVVPGFTPYESRVHFGARSGGQTAAHDIDDINVQYIDPAQSILSLGSYSYSVGESQAQATLAVTRSGDTQISASVRYATTDETAVAGTDYATTSGSLTFAPGETSKSITVPILNDPGSEADETFMVSLDNPSSGAAVGGLAEAGITIIDDEAAQITGHWSDPISWPAVPIHMHLLPTGQVMFWDLTTTARLWDPATQALTIPAVPGYDIFCSGHTFLADGRLLVTGGQPNNGDPAFDGVGLRNASVYDPVANTWTSLPDMNAGRWYPTNTILGNGDVLVTSGSVDTNFTPNTLPQVFQAKLGSWRDLTGAQDRQPYGADLYPRMFLIPDGRVFKAGPDQATWFLDTSSSGAWTQGPSSNFGFRGYGSTVMYDVGKILLAGGGDPPTPSAEVIDLNVATPAWQNVAPLAFPRRHQNATMLPDGKVLFTGGTSSAGFNEAADAVLPAEIWDPATMTSTVMAAMQVKRAYHSTALLLPDGRVITGGGGEPAAGSSFDQKNAEIYSPPYLFKGPRPTISAAPTTVTYGQTFSVQSADATSISKVTWIRLASVTHTFDQDQRFINLTFAQAPGGLNITAPGTANVAPPGYYMVFILNGKGVPSVAKIIRLADSLQQAPSTTTIGSASTSSVFGQAVTFTATVSATSPGTGVPPVGENVAFLDGTITIGSGTFDSTGHASFSIATLAVGSHSITAVYDGDNTLAASSSTSLSQPVLQAETLTTVNSSINPSALGQAVTFAATVTAVAPSSGIPMAGETITFTDGATSLGTGTLDSSGQATFTTSALTVGRHTIAATFAGDISFGTSTSPSLVQFVGSPSQRFVFQVYLDLLQRPVDPSGLMFWSGLVDQGVARDQVVLGIEGSLEYRSIVVNGLYAKYLRRPAEPFGLNTFTACLASGCTVEEVAAIIVGSLEYFQNRAGGSNDSYLQVLYQDALHRAIDPSGQATFSQALANGASRTRVADAIFGSTEFDQHLLDFRPSMNDEELTLRPRLVHGLYQYLLHRDADPFGLNSFVGALQQGTRDEMVIAAIMGSGEYRSML